MSENLVHTVCTDGFEMEYAQFGNGPKPLVVIPGLAIKSVMKSADALQVPYKVFTEKYTLYFFDRKKNIQPGYSLKDMARDQALALKAMELSGVNLFGVSQGGMIAQIIAIQYPELVSKLVLASSTSKAVPSQIELIGNWARLARAHDGEGLVSAFIDDCFSKPFADRYRRAIQAMYRDVTDAEMDRFALCADLCDTVNTIGRWRRQGGYPTGLPHHRRQAQGCRHTLRTGNVRGPRPRRIRRAQGIQRPHFRIPGKVA